ncbi:MAG: hypothetical protein D6791_13425 [Chloroflexi bacterium]|nr:MAG: hypothetical protein D6791_13425 [Chloroflexota bacterium]
MHAQVAFFRLSGLRVEKDGVVATRLKTLPATHAPVLINIDDAITALLDRVVAQAIAHLLTGSILAVLAQHGQYPHIWKRVTAILNAVDLIPQGTKLNIVLLLTGEGTGVTTDAPSEVDKDRRPRTGGLPFLFLLIIVV